MAKESMKARERKREKLVAKYAKNVQNLKNREIMKHFRNFLKMLLRLDCTTGVNLPEDQKDI
jgi:hypothetical protein